LPLSTPRMADVRTRLARCFSSVFPDLGPEAIEEASPETVQAWDSLANATLITVVEEEFELEIDPDELEELLSFEQLAAYIESRTASV
jgi:acyl carrier protein